MKLVIPAVALALGLSAAVYAQDTEVKTQTRVKGDHVRAVTMVGCLESAGGNGFVLAGAVASSGKEIKSNTKIKTDRDDDATKVKTETRTKVEHGDDHTVGTSGSRYEVTPREGVSLASAVGQHVELSAVLIEPGTGNAKIEIEDQARAERENAPDTKGKTSTKLEVPRGSSPRLMALSVKPLGESCSVQ